MGKPSKWKGARERRDGGAFVPVPCVVLNSVAYVGLSAHGRMLLFDLLATYNGRNNGTLACPFSQMKARGWKSEETLAKAKRELIARKLIHETRMGARPNRVSYYAVTFYELDEDSRLEVTARSFPRGAWKLLEPVPFTITKPRFQIESLTTPVVVEEEA
jgi:hypothetical protein